MLTSFTARLSKAVRHHPRVRAVVDQFQLLARMARAYADGRYPHIPWSALVRILAALVYFVNPLDLLPDVLPLIGYTDDVTVLLWVMKSIAGEIEAFEQWEKNQSITT